MTQEEKEPIDNILYVAACGIKNTKIMTQEERDLLLKELCARLPYGIFVNAKSIGLDGEIFDINVRYGMLKIAKDICTGESELVPISDVKPYLRPMSSMTEEEHMKLKVAYDNGPNGLFDEYSHIDWLNAHHFDYRGLIPMGLALEAPEGMYKTE